jgi:hypothetical protein
MVIGTLVAMVLVQNSPAAQGARDRTALAQQSLKAGFAAEGMEVSGFDAPSLYRPSGSAALPLLLGVALSVAGFLVLRFGVLRPGALEGHDADGQDADRQAA